MRYNGKGWRGRGTFPASTCFQHPQLAVGRAPELTDQEMGQQILYWQQVPKRDTPACSHIPFSHSAVPFATLMGISSKTTWLVPLSDVAVGTVAVLPLLCSSCPTAEVRGGSGAALSACLSPSPSIPHSKAFWLPQRTV